MPQIQRDHIEAVKPSAVPGKQKNISEVVQKNRAGSAVSTDQVNLRDLLIQRTMAKHDFTREQAIALILAFGG